MPAARQVFLDLTPLRDYPEYRKLWLGDLVSVTGQQVSVVALPFYVYQRTGSTLAVGGLGLVQAVCLITGTLAGGPIADSRDRRAVLAGVALALAAVTAGLAVLTAVDAPLPALYAVGGAVAFGLGFRFPARRASIPRLVPADLITAATSLQATMYQAASVAGPALAGLVLVAVGPAWAFALDAATYLVAFAVSAALPPLPPEEPIASGGLRAFREGLAYVRTQRTLLATFVIDLNAMIFGMPRALFPALAATVYGVGPVGLGLLYSAPSAGALAAALLTGWTGRVRRHGAAVIWAVAVWGAAITLAGLSPWLVPALAFLAVAGAADIVSAVFRSTIMLSVAPDRLRGRVSAVYGAVVAGGPSVGDAEAGVVAALTSPRVSFVSGGVACLVGTAVVAAVLPSLRRYDARAAV